MPDDLIKRQPSTGLGNQYLFDKVFGFLLYFNVIWKGIVNASDSGLCLAWLISVERRFAEEHDVNDDSKSPHINFKRMAMEPIAL